MSKKPGSEHPNKGFLKIQRVPNSLTCEVYVSGIGVPIGLVLHPILMCAALQVSFCVGQKKKIVTGKLLLPTSAVRFRTNNRDPKSSGSTKLHLTP